jgi:hypothetical protein
MFCLFLLFLHLCTSADDADGAGHVILLIDWPYRFGFQSSGIQRHEEAGRHILDALTLQNSDVVGDPRGGVTSDALWNSLKSACGRMGRLDLTDACEQRDLDSKHLLMEPPPRFS